MAKVRYILKSNSGFTLVELVIGMAIMAIVMTAVVRLFDVSLRSQQYNFDESANIQAERQILMSISDEIRNATQINSPAAGAAANTILYKKNNDVTNRSITIGTGSDANTIIFTDPNGVVIQRLGIGRVQSLQFARDGSVSRKITVNLSVKNASITSAPSNVISTIAYTLN